MIRFSKRVAGALVAGLAFTAPAFAGGWGYNNYLPTDGYGYVPPVSEPYTHAYATQAQPYVVSHTVRPYAYMHSKVIAQPTTVYRPVTRDYTVPVQSWANVETIRTVPVTSYQTVRELHQVPVVSYQTVETLRQVPVQGYAHVRAIQQVPVTSYQTVQRTEYQPETYVQTYRKDWCCSVGY